MWSLGFNNRKCNTIWPLYWCSPERNPPKSLSGLCQILHGIQWQPFVFHVKMRQSHWTWGRLTCIKNRTMETHHCSLGHALSFGSTVGWGCTQNKMLWKSLFSLASMNVCCSQMYTCEDKGYVVLGGWAPDNSLISETASEIEPLTSFNKLPFFKFSSHKQLCLQRRKSAWIQWFPPLIPITTPSFSSFFTKKGPMLKTPRMPESLTKLTVSMPTTNESQNSSDSSSWTFLWRQRNSHGACSDSLGGRQRVSLFNWDHNGEQLEINEIYKLVLTAREHLSLNGLAK